MGSLQQRLFQVEQRYRSTIKNGSSCSKRLRVFYGWAKVNKIRKKEAISVIFENDLQPEERVERFVSRMQVTCFVREQTDGEKQDASFYNRMFTEYSVFLDDKQVKGSVEVALRLNNQADRRNVSAKVRNEIEQALRKGYLLAHPDYQEPVRQLDIDFE